MSRTTLVFILTVMSSLSFGYSGGAGTADAPYQIADANDLLALAATTDDYSKCFILTADIDLQEQTFSTAIIAPDTDSSSSSFQGTEFAGTFDGNNHKITNFAITSEGNDYLGLFGYIGYDGEVGNLALVNCNITGDYCIGGIAGTNRGVIDGCGMTGVIDGGSNSAWVGGLVGFNGNGVVRNSYSVGSVSGSEYVGGLIGFNAASMWGEKVHNCYSTGIVSGRQKIGGLIGYNSESDIIYCYSGSSVSGTGQYVGGLLGYNEEGAVSQCYSMGSVEGGSYVGGLVGNNNSGNIDLCYSTGAVAGIFNSENIGGLIGHNSTGNLGNSYSTGPVIGGPGSDDIGGLIGDLYSGSISNCYSAGAVSGSSSVGGLIGYKSSSGIVTGSFWDTQTSGQTVSAGGTGKTTTQMKTLSVFVSAGWDFRTSDGDPEDWYMPSNYYPQLAQSPLVSVPYVTGMTQADAELSLSSAGLTRTITMAYNNSIPAGTVISQFPSEGILVNAGQSVQLVVSIGDYLTGQGTQADPYRIQSIADLQTFVDPVGIGLGWAEGTYVRLEADLDLNGITFGMIGNDDHPYYGIFDGDGHTIKNLILDVSGVSSVGFFGYVEDSGVIKNLALMDITINNSGYAANEVVYSGTGGSFVFIGGGGLVGYNGGSISNCSSTGIIHPSTNWFVGLSINGLGGLAGINGGSISNCYSTCDVNGSFYQIPLPVGGLVGRNSGSINACYSTGLVCGASCPTGGLPSIPMPQSVGGLVGENGGTINQCHSTSTVSGDIVGGLVGDNYNNISNCYSGGSVNGSSYTGGLVGRSSGNINTCYSIGLVSGESSCGLIGINLPMSGMNIITGNFEIVRGFINSSFWDVQTSGTINGASGVIPDPNGITGKTTAEMKTLSTFTDAGWDFTSVWGMALGQYPELFIRQAGDLNLDTRVDMSDLMIFAQHWLEGM